MHVAHGPSSLWGGTMHSHTALLHLNPEPNPIIHTRSPFCMWRLASMYANSYHKQLLDMLPNRCSVILDDSTCLSDRPRLRWISSITARPPAWMQICSNAVRKLGTYNLVCILRSFVDTKDIANKSFSESGRTSGARVVMLALSVLAATAMRSMERSTPLFPLPSSF